MKKRPWEHLPLPPPSQHDPSVGDSDFFYREFVQPMISDMIRLMATGIHIDQDAVEGLRATVQSVLEDVDKRLSENPVIKKFREHQYKIKYAQYLDEMETKKKPIEHFLKEYKPDNMVHRTYLVNTILEEQNFTQFRLDKWSVNDIKKLLQLEDIPALHRVLDKTYTDTDRAMTALAQDKMEIYNKSHYDEKIQAKTFDDIVPKFNPGSSTQKADLLTTFLGYEPLSLTDGGAPQWSRQNVETLSYTVEDEHTKDILQCLIDYSFGAIIQDNFINAFDKFTINDTLHGNVKLFGAKSLT